MAPDVEQLSGCGATHAHLVQECHSLFCRHVWEFDENCDCH
jgi:hypothetical protein